MAIDPHYIPAFTIEEVILDKDTGAPLSGGIVTFERALQPGVLKPVYQITGTDPDYSYIELPNPMTLSSIGTFEDALGNPVVPYFFPYNADFEPDYYRMIVESSEDVPQFVRDPVPYIQDGGDVTSSTAYENEIANPQFSEVLFDTSTPTYVYNVNAASQEVINIAPDWDLIVSSAAAGTVTVNQITPAGSLNIITNPGTILSINSAGLSRLRLRQRLYGSPNLWGSGFLAGSFVAKTYSGTDVTLTLYYSQSDGTVVDEAIVTGTLDADGLYAAHVGSVSIPASTSTEFFPDAYVDIEFDIPLSVHIDITSVMLAATGEVNVPEIVYDQTSQNRQIDHLFHYYKPQLEFKPIPSMLVGWDFPLNPAQFVGASLNMTTTAAYIWDQTISNTVVGNVAVVRSAFSGGLQATTANADEAFYVMQYLDGNQAREILGNRLAVNINAFRSQAGGAVTCKVYLYSGRTAATFPTLPTALGTIDAAGEFTLTAADWTEIPRGNLGQASGNLSVVSTAAYTQMNDVQDLKFNGWQLTDSTQISDTDKFAVVVTFSCPTSGTVVTIDSISLVKGDIPTRPGAQTVDEVLRECEYYWEKSWNNNNFPASVTETGALMANMTVNPVVAVAGVISSYATDFGFQMKIPKRVTGATVTMYSPASATGGFVESRIYNAGSLGAATNVAISNWAAASAGEKYIRFDLNSIAAIQSFNTGATPIGGATAVIHYQYTVDARLGVV
jgi:hypothetical protein